MAYWQQAAPNKFIEVHSQLTSGPLAPIGPGNPRIPGSPIGPLSPGKPDGPGSPLAPSAPFSPLNPLGPYGPGLPGNPVIAYYFICNFFSSTKLSDEIISTTFYQKGL